MSFDKISPVRGDAQVPNIMCSDTFSAPSLSIFKTEVSPWTRSLAKAYTKITSHKQAIYSVLFCISLLFYNNCAINIYHVFIDFKKAFDSTMARITMGNHENVKHQQEAH